MRLIIFGPPGSGKGTHSDRISEVYALPHISTGDILRDHVARGTEFGKRAGFFVNKGEYVPDGIVNEILDERLERDDCKKGFILDGYPRTLHQTEALEGILRRLNVQIDLVINLDVSEEEIIRRLSARRVCFNCKAIYNLLTNPPKKEGVCDICGGSLYVREDDKPEVIRNRLQVYKRNTKPLLDQYAKRGKLINIDGNGSIDEVFNRIRKVLDQIKR